MPQPRFLTRLLRDQSGATALEYGLICSLIVIAMVSALNSFADENQRTWETVSAKVSEASKKANGG